MRRAKLFTAHDAIAALQCLAYVAWPAAAVAASQTMGLGQTLVSVTFLDWMSLLTLSFVSGLVALLYRVRTSLDAAARFEAGEHGVQDQDLQLIPWWIFAGVHMAGAMFIGVISFFACEWLSFNSFFEAAVIALASWSGAKLADRLADGFSDGVIGRMASAFGSKP